MREIISASLEDTIKAGCEFAKTLSVGDIVALVGDLGAGKTAFSKGIASGLGINRTITSPTFTLFNIYENKDVLLYHFDLYRLGSFEEAEEAGLTEYVGAPNAITLVEWHSNVPELMPKHYKEIEITKISDNGRKIEIKEK